MKPFEIIEHTADVAIRVWGNTEEDLFANAAYALFSLITHVPAKPLSPKTVSLDASCTEDLLGMWLNELISLFYTDNFQPCGYTIRLSGGDTKKLSADIKGNYFDPKTSKIEVEIKAATYHKLKIEKEKEGVRVDIIFDV